MGRSGICINFNAMEQMWIDKGKINTLKTFIRQPMSKPMKNASILLQFITKLVDMFNAFRIFIYTEISTMININNFNISNPYVKIMFLMGSKGNKTSFI